MGAIVAVIAVLPEDIWRIAWAWLRGISQPEVRGSFDYRMGWYVIVGTIPVGIAGLLGRDLITGALRNLWWVAGALIVWSGVMVLAERWPPSADTSATSRSATRSSSGSCSAFR